VKNHPSGPEGHNHFEAFAARVNSLLKKSKTIRNEGKKDDRKPSPSPQKSRLGLCSASRFFVFRSKVTFSVSCKLVPCYKALHEAFFAACEAVTDALFRFFLNGAGSQAIRLNPLENA
jgi:hypothetical protein